MSCQLSSGGRYAVITFDRQSSMGDTASVFQCSKILMFNGAEKASCRWKYGSSSLWAYPSAHYYFNVSDELILVPHVLRAACPIQGGLECDEWPTAAIQSCKITSPDDPIVPIVSLSAPSTIGRCVDFELDVTGSVGSGGRKWEKITVNVTVSSTSLYTIKNLSDINYFYSYMYQISPPTRLPGAYLHTDVDYLFTVTLCNFLRQCGVNRHMLTVVNYFLPVVSIVGLPNRMTYSRHALRLTSKAYVPACAAEWSQRDLSYNWSVELNDKVQHGLVNTLEDETKFKLPGYALRVWLEYKVTVIASLDLLNVKSMASVLVNVIPSSVVAVLSGGSAQTVRLGEVIVVSGSDSYDEDVFGTTGISAGLNFSWTCFEVTTGGSCVLAVTSTVNADAFVGMADIQSSVGKTVAVKLTVFGSYNRTDTAVTYVSVLPSVSPKVALSVSTFRIRHADKAKIFANVEIPVASQALWSINDTTVDLRSIALTPVGSRFGNGSVGTFNLVIGGGNLHLGSAYAFCLTVGQSAAIITIEVMDSPIPGAFDVFPSLGYEFRDIFVMSVSQWVDSELPLTYSYGFLASDDSLLIVQPRSELSHISARLPGGFSTIQYSLTCVVTAYNIYDAKASLSHIVTVLPLFTDVINLNITIEELLEASASDVDFTWQTISVGLAMLNNNHNCSMAPNCTMLHRDACTTTDHVCGACSEGYYGEHTGHHANTECYPVSSKEMSIDDNACDEDNSCGIFGKCLDGVCLYPSKSCPLDCFGKGMCLMVRLATGEIVDTCLTNDVTCRAVCSCYSGYSGVSCGTSVAVIHAKQDVKLKLAQTAEKLIVEYSDQSEESVEAAVSLVAQLGVNLHELISESCSILERMISHLLNDAQELGMAYETVKKVFAVVDACVEIEFVHGNVNTFDQVLNQYTQLAISNMELGQENVGFIGDTIRTVLSLQPQAENSFVVDIPRSAIEISQGINKSSVRFHGTYSSRVSGSVTLVEVSQKIYSNYSALLANPIKIEVVVSDAAVGERLEFSAMMINNIAIDYNSTTGRSSSMLNDSFVNVCATGEHSVFNHTCPISGIVVTHRCLGTRQTLVSTCPRVQLVPVCREIVSGILDVDSIACKVLSYDSTYTLCSCTMEIASIRRLSDSSNEDVKRSGAMELVVMATYTYTGAVETIYQADDITIRSVVNSVLVLSFFAGLWGCGLLLIAELTRLSAIKTMTPTGGRKRSEKSVVGSLLHDTSRDKKDYLMMYIKYAIPGYDLKSMVVEAMRHHKISLIVFSSGRDAEEKRLLMGLYLLSIQTMLMFTLALCYDLENPEDDGTCKGYTTQATCLDERSMFDASKTMCKWVPGDSGVFVCEYRDPDFSARVIIIVSIFVSIVTAPMNLIVVFLFESILCAPSEDDHKAKLSFMSNLSRKMSHTVRRASNVIHKMSAAMEMPNMRVKKQSSILSGLITDVTRDIPDTVANAHALATSAMKSVVDRTNDDEERNFSHVTYPDDEQSLNSILRQRTLSRLSSVEESGILQQLSIVLGNTTGYALESECIQATYSDFLRAITNYRDSISDEEKVKLDKAWGWNARRCRVGNEFAAKRAILQAETICIEKISKLSSASDLEAGLEIIHLFVFDLLGRDTSAGIIFNRITEDKFKYTYVVTFYSKFLAWVAVIFLNFFFLFFIFLRASSREFAWQVGFVVACIIQLVIELILYETTEMVYIYFLIPRLVAADVAESLEALKQAVDKAYSNDSRKNESSFNSAAFFFASHQLATFFPNSFEASIVQSFSSTLPPPGMLLKPKRRLRDRHRNRFESVVKILRRFGVTAMLVAALKFIGSLPIRYQQILLHIVQPVIIGLIYLAGLMLWRNPFLFVIPGVLFMLTTVWLYLCSGKMPPVEEKLISRNLTPHNTVTPVVSCTGISEERIDVVTEEGDLRRVYPRDETDGMNKLEKKLGIEEIRNPRCTYAHPYEGKLRQGLFISNISSGENDDSSGSKAVSSFEACYDMNGSVETNNTNDQSSDACNSSTISECYDKYGKRRSNRDVYDVLISDCSSDESKESLISEECASSYSSSSSVYSDGFYSSESDTA